MRSDSGVLFDIGCHGLLTPKRGSTVWRGVHWGWADNFCLMRYLRDRRDRLSDNNRQNELGLEKIHATQESVQAELKAHENDPKLF